MTSEIRANTLKNRVGLGTIEYSNTGPVISGVTTASNFKTGSSNLHSTGLTVGNTFVHSTGVNATSLDISGDIDVDGHTNLDNVSIAGVSTVSGGVHISGHGALVGTPHKYFYGRGGTQAGGLSIHAMESSLELVSSEDSTHGGSILLRTVTDGVGLVYNSSTNALEFNLFTPSSDHFAIHGGGVNLSSIDTQLRIVKDAAVELYHNGTKKLETSSTGINVTGGAVFTSTDAGSAAEPEVVLYRNSASPADADYLGQFKFNGKSDTGAQRTYAKITGKILDASNGTEDGILEFAHIKAGSQTITGRWRSDSLQLLNGTALTVAGTSSFSDHVDIADNKQLRFGASTDFKIEHNTNENYIDSNSGHIYIRANVNDDEGDNIYIQPKSGENSAIFIHDGAVELYYNDVKTFETTNEGVTLDTNSSSTILRLNSNTDAVSMLQAVGNDLYVKAASSGSIYMVGNGNEVKLSIYSNGKLATNGASSVDCGVGGLHLYLGDGARNDYSTAADGLIIEKNGNTGLSIDPGSSGTAAIYFPNESNHSIASITHNNSTGELRVRGEDHIILSTNGNTERLRIDSTGRMTQNGTTSADTASALTLKNGQSGNDHTILELISDPNQYSLIYMGASDDRYKGQIRYKDNDHFMDFRVGGNDRVRINNSGDSGILKIADNNTSSAGNHGFRFGSWGIQMRDTGGFNHWYIRRNYGGWQTSPQVTFKGNGYTGVNRLDPTHYLDVDGTSIFRDRIFSGTMSMKSIPFGANVTYDTGISINGYGYGGSILAICSRNYGSGTNTQSGLYLLKFHYDGNNTPQIIHIAGSNFVTFDKSGSNTLTVHMGASNNNITMIESSVVNP